MKKAVLLLITVAIGTASCGKRCWECTVNIDGVVSQEKICDKTKKEISDMEANPLETKDKSGTVIYTTTFSNCTKQ